MKENETLKYFQKGEFNSKKLNEYDEEGQRYFLSYLLKTGYKFNIKNGQVEFTDILSEDKVQQIIDRYNSETMLQNLNLKQQTIREIRVIGIEDYSKKIEKDLKILKGKENKLLER